MTTAATRITSTGTTNTNTGTHRTAIIPIILLIILIILLIIHIIHIIPIMGITLTTASTITIRTIHILNAKSMGKRVNRTYIIHIRITARIMRNTRTIIASTRTAVITRGQPPESLPTRISWEYHHMACPYLWRARSSAWRETTR
jgi:hypothetical protein